MHEEVFEAVFIIILIIINGLFSMSELALVSIRKARLQQLAEEGLPSAEAALKIASAPNRLLPTVQIGITLVGILTGAMGGQALSARLNEFLQHLLPFLQPYTYGISLAVVVLIIAFFSLVAGELVPKRLALLWTERIALSAGQPMLFVSRLFGPLVKILGLSTDWGLRLIGAHDKEVSQVSDEEIKILMQEGTDGGVFEETEQDMVEGIFRLSDWVISDIMKPRTEIVFLDLDSALDENLEKIKQNSISRYPAAHGDLDHVQGMIEVRDILLAVLKNRHFNIDSLVQPPLFLPEKTPALQALEEIKTSRQDTALIIDEYGGLLGMVTLADVFRSIVGDVTISGVNIAPQKTQRPDGSWLLDGLLNIDELKQILNIDMLPDEERIGYQTLGGFVMNQLNTVPLAGQSFVCCNIRFEVLDMDGRRVDKVLAELVK
jgi:putative hemolysin